LVAQWLSERQGLAEPSAHPRRSRSLPSVATIGSGANDFHGENEPLGCPLIYLLDYSSTLREKAEKHTPGTARSDKKPKTHKTSTRNRKESEWRKKAK